MAAAIDKMFENSDAPTKTLTEKQFQLQFMEMMGNVKFLINGISLIILFAVTLIVANTVAMSARERVTEIAVMRTLGFGRGHILGFILSESVLMSLLGGVLGVLLAKFFFIPAARRRGQQDVDLDLAGQLPGLAADAGCSPSSSRSASASSPASSRPSGPRSCRIVDGLRQVV